MLSSSTISELRRELAQLGQQRDDLQRQIEAIQAMLASVDDEGREHAQTAPNGATFAARLRGALQTLGHTCSTREVTDFLEQQREEPHGATPLSVMVGAELFRMPKRRTGGVVRVSRGRYRVEATN